MQLTIDCIPDGPTLEEREAANRHLKEIEKQFWALVLNRPLSLFKFAKQRSELRRKIFSDLQDGIYLNS